MRAGEHRLEIASDWRGTALCDEDVATVDVSLNRDRTVVAIDAPYRADPPPPGAPGPTEGLWEYEVVELFLAADDGTRGADHRYTEIEVSPHGHYLILTFGGVRQRIGSHEALECSTSIHGGRWRGTLRLDSAWLPTPPLRANAYRLCGRGSARRYLAAYPVPGDAPDFHQIDRFRTLER